MVWLHEADVVIQTNCIRTGRTVRTQTVKRTSLGYCLDDANRALLVVGRSEKEQLEWPVAGGVQILARFAEQGKATLTIPKQHKVLLVSRADPHELISWLRALRGGGPSAKAMLAPAPTSASEAPAGGSGPLSKRTPGSANVPQSPTLASPSAGQQRKSRNLARSPEAAAPSPVLSPGSAQRLTAEQQVVLKAALRGESFFFTGGAGTGKSFLLHELLRRLPPATTFATATTGIAACAIGGVTIHHWAGIGDGEKPMAELARNASRRSGPQWHAARTLVVDEVSMLDGGLLDKLEEVARRVRGNQRPFGGIQLILCGDFFQLPPVSRTGQYTFAFEAACWPRIVQRTFELQQVFRQTDAPFIAALAQIRMGTCDADAERLLRSRIGARLDEADGIVATRLHTHKADCASVNKAQLAKLPGEESSYTARDAADSDECLRLLRASCVAPDRLVLKDKAQVVLVKTLDAAQGLVNGARGVVIKFTTSSRLPVVRFECGVEHVVRAERFPLVQRGRVVASRAQLPLDHGWAISVHRSQGMTLDRVQMSLGRVFECGQMYVALSRARSLEGMALVDIDFAGLRANDRVLRFHHEVVLGGAAAPALWGAKDGAQVGERGRA